MQHGPRAVLWRLFVYEVCSIQHSFMCLNVPQLNPDSMKYIFIVHAYNVRA